MKKKLLTAAVGAALASVPALYAQAEVKLYGHIQVELASEKVDPALGAGTGEEFVRTNAWNGGNIDRDSGGDRAERRTTIEDNQRGRFGIQADEDLGGGLKAIALLEYDVGDTPTSGTTPFIREANVGLQGAFGTILLGSVKSPYKYTGGVAYDPFVTTNLEARRNGGMTGGLFGHNGFLSNMIVYRTPKDLPVDVWVAYSPDKNGADSDGNEGGTVGDQGDYAASVKFGQKTWEVFLATAHNKDHIASGIDAFANDYTANKVGGKVSFGNHTIVAQYEDTEEDINATTTREGKLLFVGYHFKMGNTTLIAQIGSGELDQTGAAATQEHTYLTVGAVHNFSKTARLFGGYSTTSVDNQNFVSGTNGDRKVLAVGLRKDF